MYPADIFSLFPPFPRRNRVFVAMSFDEQFEARWNEVLKPGIEDNEWQNETLEAHRVDLTKKSDSIITEIVQEIAECRIVLADLSTIGYLDKENRKPIRNSNVMYEVGLAHAARRPEEVSLLRSDHDSLDFDIAGVRVHRYNPCEIGVARKQVGELVSEALKSVDLQQSIAVKKGVDFVLHNRYQIGVNYYVGGPGNKGQIRGRRADDTECMSVLFNDDALCDPPAFHEGLKSRLTGEVNIGTEIPRKRIGETS